MKKITFLFIVFFVLTISYSFGQTVTKTFTPPSPITVDGCGTYCVTLPGVTFSAVDFPNGCEITNVDVSITWIKTDGTCASPGAGNSFHAETNFRIDGPASQVVLARPATWSGGANSPQVTTIFDQSAAVMPSGTPVSGSFLPNNGNLNTFNGSSAFGTWNLSAGDTAGADPLCISSYSVTITVATDITDPTWTTAPSNLTVECDGSGNTADLAAWLISFSGTDNCGTATVTDDSTGLSDDCGATGFETVTFTLDDGNGNSIAQDATFTIEDTTDPVWATAPSNMTVECDGAGNTADLAAWLISFSGTDACGSAAVTDDSTGLSDLCGATGAETVTFTLTDECGNDITMDATFTIEDTTDPVWATAPSNMTVECDGSGNTADLAAWLISFSGTDTCGSAAVTDDSTGLSNNCGATGFETVTFTLTDECGNDITMDATFTIEDTTDPVWATAPSNLTVECDGSGNTADLAAWLISFSGTDACGSAAVTDDSTGLSNDCGATGFETVTFTLTDECGNDITMDATFTIEDTTDPVWATAPADLTVECDGSGNTADLAAWLISFSGTDACGSAAVTDDSTGLSDDCGATGAETVTFTLTDECGNDITMDATFTIEDTNGPDIFCTTDVFADTDPDICGAEVWFVDAIAFDTCGSASVAQTGGLPSGSLFPVGDSVIEYTATDECGNTSTCSFTITVTDNEPAVAVCQDITIQLDEFGNASILDTDLDGGSTDNCGIGSISASQTDFDCSDVGENDIILTVTDVNGNESTCIAVVTVEDVTSPEVFCQDITVQLDANGTVTIAGTDIDSGSNDACGIDSYELDIDTFDCSNIGDNPVVLTVTDVNGNSSTCSAIVTVEDTMAPVIVCADITLELGADGTASITPEDITVTFGDNCGIDIALIDIVDFDCSDIGTPVTVTLFAIDASGNPSTCSSLVTVVDLLGPEIVCPADQTVNLDPNGTHTLGDYIADGSATATDNCTDPVTIFSQDPAPGTILGFGVHIITFTAEDEYGNVSTCSFELNIDVILGEGDIELTDSGIIMYPNPANNVVNISNPQNIELVEVIIYDLLGRIVGRSDLKNMGLEKSIDISNLANATYMLIIRGAQGTVTKHLIVSNY